MLSSLSLAGGLHAEDMPEYRLKAAFIYNFMVYTEWPPSAAHGLNLCLVGPDPFGRELDALQGKTVTGKPIRLLRKAVGDPLKDCQVAYIAQDTASSQRQTLEALRGQAVLSIADSPGALRRGAVLNMNVVQGKVSFEANLLAARQNGLELSSKLLRLATEVVQ